MVILTAGVYSFMPLIDGDVPIPVWYPRESFKAYCQFYEILWMCVFPPAILAIDVILMGLMHLMAAQIKTLNYNLCCVTDRNPDYDVEIQEKQVQENLKICIRHHLAISE